MEIAEARVDRAALLKMFGVEAVAKADPARRLKDRLAEWTDFDSAAYELGVLLGLWPEWVDLKGPCPWGGTKHIFWTANPLGEALHDALKCLVKAGVLEFNEEETRFRWNAAFDWRNDEGDE